MSEPGVFSPRVQRFAPIGDVSPAVSVVTTVYNDMRFLEESVQGVLGQSFSDFELIVVDNGSNQPDTLAELATRDPRVRVLRLEDNLGTTGGGNFGIAAARAPIVARMDADDVAEPDWLALVMEAFAADDELGLVGCWASLMTEHGDPVGSFRAAESDFAIRFTLLSHNPFVHSSTAYRRALYDLVDGSQAYQLPLYELGLWRAMLPRCRARNLPQTLVRYRYNPQGVSASWEPGASRLRARCLRLGLWRELGLDYPLEDLALAECFDDFLRDDPCRHAALWPELRRVVDLAIAGMLARRDDFMRPEEALAQQSFVADLLARLDEGPRLPPGRLSRLIRALRLRGPRRTFVAALRKLEGWF